MSHYIGRYPCQGPEDVERGTRGCGGDSDPDRETSVRGLQGDRSEGESESHYHMPPLCPLIHPPFQYNQAVRSRVFNLNDKSNPALRENVLSGAISAEKFATMSSEEMTQGFQRSRASRAIVEIIRGRRNSENAQIQRDITKWCGKPILSVKNEWWNVEITLRSDHNVDLVSAWYMDER